MAGVRELFAGSVAGLRSLDYVQSCPRFCFHGPDRRGHCSGNIFVHRKFRIVVLKIFLSICIRRMILRKLQTPEDPSLLSLNRTIQYFFDILNLKVSTF